MCKIIAILNSKPGNEETNATIQKLIEANTTRLSSEGDGYAVFRNNRTFKYVGLNAYKNIDRNIKYKGENTYIIHTRTKTAGSDGADGLHLDKVNGYYFAHNGTVSKYAGVKNRSDSYYFFKHFFLRYKNLNLANIEKWAGTAGFAGKGILYNPDKNDFIFFANQAGHITVIDGALIFSSWEIEREYKKITKREVMGFSWYSYEGKESIAGVLHDEKLDDTYIRIKNGQVVDEEIIDIKTDSTLYSRKHWNNATREWEDDDPDKFDILSQLTLDDLILSRDQEIKIEDMILEGYDEQDAIYTLLSSGEIKSKDIKPGVINLNN